MADTDRLAVEHVPLHRPGLTPPDLDAQALPQHVACVMDGNGRWANSRGLPRTEGHRVGEATMMDVIAGAVELGIPELSVYAFSTENWRRSPAEVRFLMGFTRTVLRSQTDDLDRWACGCAGWAGSRGCGSRSSPRSAAPSALPPPTPARCSICA